MTRHPSYRVMLMQSMQHLHHQHPRTAVHLMAIRSQFKRDWVDNFNLARHWPRLLWRSLRRALADQQIMEDSPNHYRVKLKRQKGLLKPTNAVAFPPLPLSTSDNSMSIAMRERNAFPPLSDPTAIALSTLGQNLEQLTSERDQLLEANRQAEVQMTMMEVGWREEEQALQERLDLIEWEYGDMKWELEESLRREDGLRRELADTLLLKSELEQEVKIRQEDEQEMQRKLHEWLKQGQELFNFN